MLATFAQGCVYTYEGVCHEVSRGYLFSYVVQLGLGIYWTALLSRVSANETGDTEHRTSPKRMLGLIRLV